MQAVRALSFASIWKAISSQLAKQNGQKHCSQFLVQHLISCTHWDLGMSSILGNCKKTQFPFHYTFQFNFNATRPTTSNFYQLHASLTTTTILIEMLRHQFCHKDASSLHKVLKTHNNPQYPKSSSHSYRVIMVFSILEHYSTLVSLQITLNENFQKEDNKTEQRTTVKVTVLARPAVNKMFDKDSYLLAWKQAE